MKLIKINLKHIIRHIGFKITMYIAAMYILLVSCSLAITFFAFLSIGHFKNQIEAQVFKYSGYKVQFGNINSEMNDNYLPEVIIDDFKLQNPTNTAQNMTIHKLKFALSYSTIWQLAPILDNLYVNGSNINIKYLINNDISINGFIINTKPKKAKPNSNKFNFEKLILKQKNIFFSNINVNFEKESSSLPQISFNNIVLTLNHGLFNSHNLKVSFGDNSINKPLDLDLSWTGDTFSNFKEWKQGNLSIKNVEQKDNFISNLSKYIPTISTLDDFNTSNIITAKIKNGQLSSLYANFNVNNLALSLPHSLQKLQLPKLGGTIHIDLNNSNQYILKAENLTLSTDSGYVFNNKNADGNYLINHSGYIKLVDANLDNLNNILKFIPNINKLKISGQLDIVNFAWFGNIFTPSDIQLKSIFSNISIISTNPYIPSLNNVSGEVVISRHNGHAVINLTNSTLDYKYMFLEPYKFKRLDAEVNWQESSNKSIIFNLQKGDIKSIDFNGDVLGQYIYEPTTLGYLDLNAHIDRIEVHKIGSYLPKIIGIPTLQWLNSALISGYGNHGKLELKGNLIDFPFNKGKGIFYIDANIEKGKLLFADGWPTINNIDGTFQIRNQKIIILAKTANSMENQIESVTATIPDMTADHLYLTADGTAHGNTPNFIKYLVESPLNKILGKFPEKVDSSGSGQMKLHLKVPFENPNKTNVNGIYNFNSNTLKINLPIPLLTNVNGGLNFFESGISINNINATAFASNIAMTASTTNNVMHFHVTSNNLDYQKAGSFYLPLLKPVVSGIASTSINFNIDSNGLDNLNLQSNLYGVKLDVPAPLYKDESIISAFNLQLKPNSNGFGINFAYNDLLSGDVELNHDGGLSHGRIGIGMKNLPEQSSNNAKIAMYIKTNSINVLPWADTIDKVLATSQKSTINKEESATTNQRIANTTASNPALPIEITLLTQNTFIGKNNFYNLNANAYVKNDQIVFNLNNRFTNGYGEYVYKDKSLNIKLNNFHILKNIESGTNSSTPKTANSNQTWIDFAKLNLESASNKKIMIESQPSTKNYHNIADRIEKESSISAMPNTTINIDQLYYENNILGKLYLSIVPSGKNLLFKKNTLIGNSFKLDFSGMNSCFKCSNAFTDFNLHAEINDLGLFLEKLNYGKIVSKGSGTIDTDIQWNGNVSDFSLNATNVKFNIVINNGSFLKVSSGSVFGKILGLINLQTITNFIKLDFGQVFSSGFYFDVLNIQGVLSNNIIDLKSMIMNGPLASVKMHGTINLWNETVELHMVIIPHLSTGVAVGAAVATGPAGIVVGPAVYAAEWILGQPFSKLFSFSFHVTGTLDKPNIEKEDITHQIVKNVNSAIGY